MFSPGDQQHRAQLSEIHSRLVSIMPRATIGLADDTVIKALEHILDDLKALFNALTPQDPACDPIEVQSTMAQTMIHLAHAYEALRNSEQTLLWYEQAAQKFEAIGQAENVKYCRGAIARLQFINEGTFDAEFQRLQERLAAQPQGSLPYIEIVIALGDLYKDAGDLFEAERMYVSAEKALEPIRPAPLDNNAALQLEQLLFYCQEIEFLYDLHYRLYSNMVYLYRDRDSTQAGKYFQRARESEAIRSEYRHTLTVRIVNALLASVYEIITVVGQGLLTSTQSDLLIGGLNALAASNLSLPTHASRDELLQELQELLTDIEGQGPVQDVVRSLQSHVRQFNAFIEGIYQRQAIERHAEMMHLLEVQLAFDVLRRDIQTFGAQSHEQQTFSADDLMKRAQALEDESHQLDMLEGVTTARMLMAELLMALQRDDEAITALVEARRLLSSHWQHDRGVAILARLAEANAHKHDWAAVSSFCDEGIELIEQYRYKVSGQYLQSSYLESRIRLYSLGVESAYELRDYALMLQRAELSKCRSVLRYRQKSLVPTEEGTQTEQEFRRVCQQIDAVHTAGNAQGLDVLLTKRRTLWDLLLIQRTQARREDPFPEFNLAVVQASLDSDEAVVYYYWLAPTTLLIVAIDQREVIVEKRDITENERKELEDFANFILSLKKGASKYLNQVQRFSTLLLPDTVRPMLEKKQRVIFSPHRLLHTFPFHALRWNDDYLIHRFAVSYTPNLSNLLVTYTPAPTRRVLALGIQDFAVPGEQINSLKAAEQEVDALENLYKNQAITINVLKGPRATKQNLQQWNNEGKLAGFTLLHFATHGADVRGDTPMESYLFLQDARLDGLEIADWRLNAELVVLSACHSGQRAIAGRGMTELPGDEIFGLQAAFFMAGARRIVGALWPAESQCACQIMTDFHRYLVDGKLLPEVALQTAMIDYLAIAPMKLTYFWAPFFISAIGRSSGVKSTIDEH